MTILILVRLHDATAAVAVLIVTPGGGFKTKLHSRQTLNKYDRLNEVSLRQVDQNVGEETEGGGRNG